MEDVNSLTKKWIFFLLHYYYYYYFRVWGKGRRRERQGITAKTG